MQRTPSRGPNLTQPDPCCKKNYRESVLGGTGALHPNLALRIERRTHRLVALRALVGDALHGRDDRAIERTGIGPVDLDEVARGIAQVHLHGAVIEYAHIGRPRVAVEEPALERHAVGRLEVVDVEADVVELGRRGVAMEEVQLLVAD